MAEEVDSYRFIGGVTRRVIKSWIAREQPREIPWSPLIRQISECKVSLISSGGIVTVNDEPYDLQIEYDNPWYSDPSYRVIPRSVTQDEVVCSHLHVDTTSFNNDMNCLMPIDRLSELEGNGEIGYLAESHYSFIGYTTQPDNLLKGSVSGIIQNLKDEFVDIVILVPA